MVSIVSSVSNDFTFTFDILYTYEDLYNLPLYTVSSIMNDHIITSVIHYVFT